MTAGLPGIRGLFQQRVEGGPELLSLAALRFRQAGMPAELYADTPAELELLLDRLPEHETLPTVHLNRRLDLLQPHGRDAVQAFVTGFTGRVAGFVVHDQSPMRDRTSELVAAMHLVGDRVDGPFVFLEYAAFHPFEWFVQVAQRSAGAARASMCVDIGHVGLSAAWGVLRREANGRTGRLLLTDPALAGQVELVEQARRSGLPAVLAMIDELAPIGKPVHFHLHDAHPAQPGLSDHFSFLTRFPVPFEHDGLRSLPPMFGVAGAGQVLRAALAGFTAERLSLTLEIHQAEGRLPLEPEAAALFAGWPDPTGPERLNYWLSVIAQNHQLVTSLSTAA
jgi:hypothetical protein